ncbi:MAG: hypothetical protein A2351_04345 [Omnitrophica bacterium RIFOXYB12_FULL_50_7]|nr:MAG: hypothetical protein A2351_04345 [Omnitrophica bacterium RIFOXYB12_FULL_50_7]
MLNSKIQETRNKKQEPRSKNQANSKFRNTNRKNSLCLAVWNFGYWTLGGVWILALGTSALEGRL